MSATSRSKVERVIDAHDLDITGEKLEEKWTEKRESVRSIAYEVNAAILDSCLRENDVILDDHIVDSLAEEMTDGNASLTQFDFAARGIDIDSIVSDFISYQSVYNYLTNCRGATIETDTRSPSEFASSIDSLRGRTETVASQAIARLNKRGHVASPEPIVDVDIGAVCPVCETRFDISVWITHGNCLNCSHGSEE